MNQNQNLLPATTESSRRATARDKLIAAGAGVVILAGAGGVVLGTASALDKLAKSPGDHVAEKVIDQPLPTQHYPDGTEIKLTRHTDPDSGQISYVHENVQTGDVSVTLPDPGPELPARHQPN